jgi:hypothetical protein
MPLGGLDIGEVLSRAATLTRFMEEQRKRRLQRENPLAGALEALMAAQQHFGQEELEAFPDVVKQLATIGAGRELEASELNRLMEIMGRVPSPARLRRRQELQQALGEMLLSLEQLRARNRITMETLGVLSGDPKMTEAARAAMEVTRATEQEFLERGLGAVMLRFPEFANDPEVQQLLRQVRMRAILPGAPVPGAPVRR